jgi:outer membrane receptor protein involved in Fe transport
VALLADYTIGQKEFWLHNFRLGYRTPEGNIEVAAWVRNIEDQRYKNYAFDASNFAKLVVNFVGPPRTVGIDLSISW